MLDDMHNDTMKYGFGVTLATPALALIATSGCRRVLWAAICRRTGLDDRA